MTPNLARLRRDFGAGQRGNTPCMLALYETETSQWGWGFHTLRGGIDPGDLRFRPRDVECLKLLKDFSSGDETISSPGATGPRSWQEGQLSLRAVSMSPGQSATRQWRGGFHAVPGGIDLRDHRLRPRGFLIVYT